MAHFEVYYNPRNPGDLIEFLCEFRYTHHQQTGGGKALGNSMLLCKMEVLQSLILPIRNSPAQ